MSNASPENTEVSCSPKETSPIEQLAATEDDTEDESSPEETTNDCKITPENTPTHIFTDTTSQAVPIASTKSDLILSSSPNNISLLTSKKNTPEIPPTNHFFFK